MPESKKPTSGKIFYGWIVAIAGTAVVFATCSFQYTFGVFIKPLADSMGWSRAAISAAPTVRSVTSTIVAPLVGTWSDRLGPKPFTLLGITLVVAGYIAASRVTNLWQLYLSLGFIMGIGLTSGFIPTVANTARWFGRRSAMPVGVVMTGFGIVMIVLPPIATFAITRYGWQVGFLVLAVAALVTGGIAWRFVRSPPGTVSSLPEKEKTPPAATSAGADFTLREALRSPTMWVLLIINMGYFLCYQMMIIHVVPATIQTGASAEAAAITLTLSGVTNIAGRLALSALTTRIDAKIVILFCFALQAASMLLLSVAGGLYVFYIAAMVYGLTFGGVIAIMPSMTGSYFGTKAVGAIFSVLNMAQNIGSGIGPLLAGYVFDVTGSYFLAFFSAAIALGFIVVLTVFLKPPHKQPAPGVTSAAGA